MREPFYWLNEDSINFLNRGYLESGVKPIDRIRQIGDYVESKRGIEGYSDKFYDYMSRGWISLSSPVWANFGTTRGLGISCFSIDIMDSTTDILRASSEIGVMTKQGGGTAGYFGNLRPRGSSISGGGVSNGAVSFMELFQSVTNTISQNSVRRGAFASYLPITHGDIEEFLTIRNTDSPIQDLSFGVTIPYGWMQSMIDGDKSKRKLWAKVLEKRSETGYPYIFFEDNANNNKPVMYKDKDINIKLTNLCVAPNTNILTSSGYLPIGDLEGKFVDVWNGEEWSNVEIVKTGVDQKLLRVTTDSGYELDCTPYHKFYIQKGYYKGVGENKLEIIEVRAKDLKKGDKLIKFDLPLIKGEKELSHAYENGFYSGDGCLTINGQRIYLYGEKKQLIDNFNIISNWTNQPEYDRMYGHTDKLKDKFFVPDSSYTVESRIKWLAGYLDADGTVTNNNGSQSLQAGSVEKNFLKEVQLMLQTLGCDSKITLLREEGDYLLPKNDGSGELGLYKCKEIYRLLINGNSLFKLSQLGLKCNRLSWDVKKPNRECSQFIKIESVEELPELSDTFCFTEPKKHLGMFNGILTGQCSEIMLPVSNTESFVCCLSSVNLLWYDEWKDTDLIETVLILLDTVMQEFIEKASSIPFFEKAVEFAKNHNAVGLGVLGLHSYLQSINMSMEGLPVKMKLNQIFKNIQSKCEEASEKLASLFGEVPMTEGYNRRFTTTCAIAPTTSSAIILGQVSQSIEPYDSNYYYKDTAKGKVLIKNPFLDKVLTEYGKNTDEVWRSILDKSGSVQHLKFMSDEHKSIFKTFAEISQLELIQNAAIIQKYIDQGISLNVKIHPDTPVKDINTLYIEAWKLGIKSLYYQKGVNAAHELSKNLLNCVSCES